MLGTRTWHCDGLPPLHAVEVVELARELVQVHDGVASPEHLDHLPDLLPFSQLRNPPCFTLN
eukprot:1097428-Rhodomonas_salina.3